MGGESDCFGKREELLAPLRRCKTVSQEEGGFPDSKNNKKKKKKIQGHCVL